MNLWAELRRRNVLRVAAAWLVFAWLTLQVVGVVAPILVLPDWVPRLVLVLLAIGFVVAVVVSWIYEVTPDGLRRTDAVPVEDSIAAESGRRLDRMVLAGLAVALLALAANRYWPHEAPAPAVPAAAVTSGDVPAAATAGAAPGPAPVPAKSIAVLPFLALSGGEDDAYFADGMTEELLNALAQLPDLRVTARTSAFHFKDKDMPPVPEVARILGVAHVLEGSVRRSGERMRITAQLVRASDGFHLWSQTYDRNPADILEVQEDIAGEVAVALDSLLDDTRREAMRNAAVGDFQAYAAYREGMRLYDRAHEPGQPRIAVLQQANIELDRALARAPDFLAAQVLRLDLDVHLLIDPGFLGTSVVVASDEQARASVRLRERLDQALASARSAPERDAIAVMRIYFSEHWDDLAATSRRLYAQRSCVPTLYNDAWQAFGGAAEVSAFMDLQLRCDPLSTEARYAVAFNRLWAGEPEAALAAIEEHQRLLGYTARFDRLQMRALLGLRRFDQAAELAVAQNAASGDRDDYRLLLLAARGDAAAVAQARAARPVRAWQPRYELPLLAALGDRAGANAMAAAIDRQPFGHLVLAEIILQCFCGAPFDLSATPTFAARIAESGFAWPPANPLPMPLKDW